jgi:hypothetical protein
MYFFQLRSLVLPLLKIQMVASSWSEALPQKQKFLTMSSDFQARIMFGKNCHINWRRQDLATLHSLFLIMWLIEFKKGFETLNRLQVYGHYIQLEIMLWNIKHRHFLILVFQILGFFYISYLLSLVFVKHFK